MKRISTVGLVLLPLALGVLPFAMNAAAGSACGNCPTETKPGKGAAPAACAEEHKGKPVAADSAPGQARPAATADAHGDGQTHDADGKPEKPADACAAGDGHGHGDEAGSDLDMTPEQIRAAQCEHQMPMMQCAECRYEVGVAKVDKSLLAPGPDGKALVRTVTAETGPASVVLELAGEVQLNENATAHVTPRTDGLLTEVKVDLGQSVKRDEVLALMQSQEAGQLLIEHEKSQTETRLAKRNYEREKGLFDGKLATEAELTQAELTYEQAKANTHALEERLRLLGVGPCDHANGCGGTHPPAGQLAILSLRDGTVIEKHAVPGEAVSPDTDLFLVADLSSVWVWAGVYPKDLARVLQARRQGPVPAEVTTDAFPGQVFKGHLDYVGAIMDETTRQIKVRISIENADEALRPGLFCTVRLRLSDAERTGVWLPKIAVLRDENEQFVYKPLEGDFWFRRRVRTGIEDGDRIEIVEGVGGGESVIAEGAFMLKSDTLRSKMGAGCAD
ncbi:MAG: hypothetical protein A3K19_31260 [Lentisphaerae bacterium RIFOXYB12_FULL_65_16]|nr:MAG: hypothetical protein A3K18_22620 [Lentisphaerae bacterium RIFOXYA12_64_32]OGV87164.1 MAG: hypothetical protein A3K19_31260 [Lentisphaerae bacterium RIFOXYB12_FULL_65_16]